MKHLQKVVYCLDTEGFTFKPKTKTAAISSRIANNPKASTIEELAKYHVTEGRTITAAIFKRNKDGVFVRRDENWYAQQLFLLDIDKGLTVKEAEDRCRKYEIEPSLIYTTLSSKGNNDRFRMVFCLPQPTYDKGERYFIQKLLQTIFPECDNAATAASNLYFGGKRIIKFYPEAYLDTTSLLFSVKSCITEGKEKNYNRELRKYLLKLWEELGEKNDSPTSDFTTFVKEFDENNATPIIYNYLNPNNAEYAQNLCIKLIGLAPTPQNTLNNLGGVESLKTTRDFNWELLKKKCQLFKEFKRGAKLDHHERFGIATNLAWIEQGKEVFLEIIENTHRNFYKWKATLQYIKKEKYKPMNCNNYCPHANKCKHATNIIKQIKLPPGTFEIITEPTYKQLSVALEELAGAYNNAQEGRITVIKAPTGIGKSEAYLNKENAVIALPTHKLKNEIKLRTKDKGLNCVSTPSLPDLPKKHKDEVEKHYKLGQYQAAQNYLHKIESEFETVQQYFADLAAAENSDVTMLTTHEHLFHMKILRDTLIIDEDILKSLLKIKSCRIQDLFLLRDHFKANKNTENAKIVTTLINSTPHTAKNTPTTDISKIIANAKIKNVKTDIVSLFNSSYYVSSDGYIHYLVMQPLPPYKKIIILSATADEFIYKSLFGDKLDFIDIGHVKNVGKIHQINVSTSRYNLNNTDLLEEVQEHIDSKNIITFKKYKEQFEDASECHFGNLEGTNELTKKDIAVIGTPHINSYAYGLYAAALGVKVKPGEFNKFQYMIVERNGIRFWFYTFKNENLRKIQMYCIERELIQAIGRARTIRNNCNVFLFSNYILPVEAYPSKEQAFELMDATQIKDTEPLQLLNN